ncbi:MAG: hypothetical protein EOP52_03085 [Sphingobacteriales bacterium]|nr:MAG: hypothetical protein EOP52_03085 [Sphingobacteriales bacterium]
MRTSFLLCFALMSLAACQQSGPGSVSAPIVMGDSTTIVTETDSQYLKSAFTDFEASAAPKPVSSAAPVAVPAPVTDTASDPAVPASPVAATGPGLKADFGDVQVFIENLRVQNGDRTVKGTSSAAYSSDGTAFTGKNLVLTGMASGATVQQKTNFGVVLNTGKQMLPLPSLGTQSTGWQALSGKNGTYALTAVKAPAFKLSAASIKNAAQQALRKARVSRKDETTLLASLASVKDIDGDILTAKPTAMLWQIRGKDTKGKSVTRDIRVDF